MAFFDKMKQAFEETSQTARQKTKDLSSVTRLNAQISDAERKINDLYYKLGFEVYKAYRENPLEAGAVQIGEINYLHKVIADCKAQIATINQASLCPGCGAKIGKNMAFCGSCGYKLPVVEVEEPAKPAKPACPNCGTEITEESAFCSNCGHRLGAAE